MGEEDPTEGFASQEGVFKPELIILVVVLDQPKQDAGTLKNIVSLASGWILDIVVDEGGDPAVGVDREELWLLLVLLLEGDVGKVVSEFTLLEVWVGEQEFFEQDGHLEAVRRADGV